MIEVRVRQQDCVNMRQIMKMKRWRGQAFRADGKTWQTNSGTWKEDGVCQNCDAKKIYKHCGMPQPGKCQLRVAPFRGLGFRKGRGDWPPSWLHHGYGLVNNPLMAFQRVRAGLGGPARATRTGTFARFKMSRVKSPMM